jgi:hypothetical protein
MSGLPTPYHSAPPAAFYPQDAATSLAKVQAIKGVAAKITDWELLAAAVEEEIALQAAFLEWWEAHVHRKGGERWIEPAERGEQGLSVEQAEDATGISNRQVSKWHKALEDEDDYRDKLLRSARRRAGLDVDDVDGADKQIITPPEIIEAARDVMGAINLDPASAPVAQQTVGAGLYLSPEENGLLQEWGGRVWLHPPHARALLVPFAEKLLGELVAGHVESAILLAPNATDASWFHEAEGVAGLICFPRGKLKFTDEDGEPVSTSHGQALFYFGEDPERFRDVFLQFGFVR